MPAPAEFFGDSEIQADRLGVADMEVAVRLRRKPRHDGFVPAGREVGPHDVTDEILTGLARDIFSNRHSHRQWSTRLRAFRLDKSADRVKPSPKRNDLTLRAISL